MFSQELIILLLAWLAPFCATKPVPSNLEHRAVDPSLLPQLNLASQYAAAAYCPENDNSTGTKITCSTGNCPLVQAANTTTTLEYENTVITGTVLFVAVDTTNSLVVLSFRGSHSIRNWLSDVEFPLVSCNLVAGCEVHAGFWLSWQEPRTVAMAAVKSAIAANPGFALWVTGHSLGGAVGAIAAADLRNNGLDAVLYTFGQPRIGNAALSTYISNQLGGNHRCTHTNDIVPQLPGTELGYVHISPEYWIDTDLVPVPANDIIVCPGAVNNTCNSGQTPPSTTAHSLYFGPISACDPEDIEL